MDENMINICDLTSCVMCPFEDECNFGFKNYIPKDELIYILNEKMETIKSMLKKIEKDF